MRALTRWIGLAAAVLGLAVGAETRTHAAPIMYTETATATGLLGSRSFTNSLITLVATADTINVANAGGVFFLVTNDLATVTVQGIGTATFTIATETFSNQMVGAVGISRQDTGFDILDTFNGIFISYNLQSSLGPVSGTAAFNPGSDFATTLGNFRLTSVSGPVTFQATIIAEPASLVTLGFGLSTVGGMLTWRRRPCSRRS